MRRREVADGKHALGRSATGMSSEALVHAKAEEAKKETVAARLKKHIDAKATAAVARDSAKYCEIIRRIRFFAEMGDAEVDDSSCSVVLLTY